jgi:predicted DNA-binding transcriptional regulator AlpA
MMNKKAAPQAILLRYEDLVAMGVVRNRTSLRRWIKTANFPAPIRLGPHSIAWRKDLVLRWLESREQKSA